MEPRSLAYRLRQIILAAIVIASAGLVYSVYNTAQIRDRTGTLKVTTSASKAIITISQMNTDAEVIGTGTSTIRLRAGTYSLAANYAGLHATTVTHVTTDQTTRVTLNLAKSTNVLPSADNIDFENIDDLVSNGLTTTQVANLKQLFFTYKKTMQTVDVAPGSIQSTAHNLGDPYFTITFAGSIDGAPYRAAVRYTSFEDVALTLTDQRSGVQLFTGRLPSSTQ